MASTAAAPTTATTKKKRKYVNETNVAMCAELHGKRLTYEQLKRYLGETPARALAAVPVYRLLQSQLQKCGKLATLKCNERWLSLATPGGLVLRPSGKHLADYAEIKKNANQLFYQAAMTERRMDEVCAIKPEPPLVTIEGLRVLSMQDKEAASKTLLGCILDAKGIIMTYNETHHADLASWTNAERLNWVLAAKLEDTLSLFRELPPHGPASEGPPLGIKMRTEPKKPLTTGKAALRLLPHAAILFGVLHLFARHMSASEVIVKEGITNLFQYAIRDSGKLQPLFGELLLDRGELEFLATTASANPRKVAFVFKRQLKILGDKFGEPAEVEVDVGDDIPRMVLTTTWEPMEGTEGAVEVIDLTEDTPGDADEEMPDAPQPAPVVVVPPQPAPVVVAPPQPAPAVVPPEESLLENEGKAAAEELRALEAEDRNLDRRKGALVEREKRLREKKFSTDALRKQVTDLEAQIADLQARLTTARDTLLAEEASDAKEEQVFAAEKAELDSATETNIRRRKALATEMQEIEAKIRARQESARESAKRERERSDVPSGKKSRRQPITTQGGKCVVPVKIRRGHKTTAPWTLETIAGLDRQWIPRLLEAYAKAVPLSAAGEQPRCITAAMILNFLRTLSREQYTKWVCDNVIGRSEETARGEAVKIVNAIYDNFPVCGAANQWEYEEPNGMRSLESGFHSGWFVDMPGIVPNGRNERFYKTVFGVKSLYEFVDSVKSELGGGEKHEKGIENALSKQLSHAGDNQSSASTIMQFVRNATLVDD